MTGTQTPRIVAFIGLLSEMVQAHWKGWFETKGFDIIGSDPKDPNLPTNEEVAARADIVVIAVRPLVQTWPTIRQVVPHMKRGSVIVIMASVPRPRGSQWTETVEECTRRGVGVQFFHDFIGPQATARGRSALAGELAHPEPNGWALETMVDLHTAQGMTVRATTLDSHNDITNVTQVLGFRIAYIWASIVSKSKFRLADLIEVMGPPAALQTLAFMQQLGLFSPHQREVNTEVLREHNLTLQTGQQLETAIVRSQTLIRDRVNLGDMIQTLEKWLPEVSPEELDSLNARYLRLIQVDGDMNGGAVEFIFTEDQDYSGLLADTHGFFDRWNKENPDRQIRKTSSVVLYDKKRRIHIWVGLENPHADEVEEVIEQIRTGLHPSEIRPVKQSILGEMDRTFMTD